MGRRKENKGSWGERGVERYTRTHRVASKKKIEGEIERH